MTSILPHLQTLHGSYFDLFICCGKWLQALYKLLQEQNKNQIKMSVVSPDSPGENLQKFHNPIISTRLWLMVFSSLLLRYSHFLAFQFQCSLANKLVLAILCAFKYYLLTESEVITEKSQTEALMY